ncbi:MAG: RIP metalloprotease RseP [Clostridiales bacterium]|nr:RIP metalloprotease RseP [Clostridiales bacterium]
MGSFLSTAGGILIALLVFGLLIFIHELGHFLTAKAAGVRVNEFSLGMGPALFKFQKGETQYALRLFPIGGYVQMEGEDSDSEDPRSFQKKPVWKRIIIVIAGAVMNLLLGFILLVIIVAPQEQLASTTISKFAENASTQATGLQIGDRITSINGTTVFIDTDILTNMLRDQDGVMDIGVERGGEKLVLHNVQAMMVENDEGQKQFVRDFALEPVENNAWETIKRAGGMTVSFARLVWLSLVDLVTGNVGMEQLSGPVGVTTAIGDAASQGLMSLLSITILITINLGVFNLLPIPALDGGRLLFLLIEAVRRKPINPKYEGYVHAAGLILLIGLMLFVTFGDIMRIISGG